jgi:hypothetical protein
MKNLIVSLAIGIATTSVAWSQSDIRTPRYIGSDKCIIRKRLMNDF